MKKITAIACMSSNKVIGSNNKLPWKKISADMEHFKNTTNGKTVIMGHNTYISLGKPLINRRNIVISKTPIIASGIECSLNIENAIEKISDNDECFLIGGQNMYMEFFNRKLCNRILLTVTSQEYTGNKTFPEIPHYFKNISRDIQSTSNNEYLVFEEYIATKYDHPEYQYLDLLKKLLVSQKRTTRNGITRSIFSPESLMFNLSNGFPLITTKKMAWKSIIHELLFFISGKTDTKILEKKGVTIWKNNSSKNFLDSRNLNYEIGDIGPMYGFNWRHFGAEYFGCNNKYSSGYDQLLNVINEIVFNPTSRRIIMTTFNPSNVEQSVLMPCHGIVTQFFVRDNYLDCHMYQRSADVFLGLPFNIASYALLVELICNCVNTLKNNTNLSAGILKITLGDCHLYEEHELSAFEQIKNVPMKWEKLIIDGQLTLTELESSNCVINKIKLKYQCHQKISGKFVV